MSSDLGSSNTFLHSFFGYSCLLVVLSAKDLETALDNADVLACGVEFKQDLTLHFVT